MKNTLFILFLLAVGGSCLAMTEPFACDDSVPMGNNHSYALVPNSDPSGPFNSGFFENNAANAINGLLPDILFLGTNNNLVPALTQQAEWTNCIADGLLNQPGMPSTGRAFLGIRRSLAGDRIYEWIVNGELFFNSGSDLGNFNNFPGTASNALAPQPLFVCIDLATRLWEGCSPAAQPVDYYLFEWPTVGEFGGNLDGNTNPPPVSTRTETSTVSDNNNDDDSNNNNNGGPGNVSEAAIAATAVGVFVGCCCILACIIAGTVLLAKHSESTRIVLGTAFEGFNSALISDSIVLSERELTAEQDYDVIPNSNELNINPDKLKMGQEIGRGAFGVVNVAKYHGVVVAVKGISIEKSVDETSTKLMLEDFSHEVEVMKSLQPFPVNVVKLIGIVPDQFGLPRQLVVEYVGNGNLKSWLQNGAPPMDSPQWPQVACKILHGIALGLSHLHAKRVIHRDLAARNILISWDNVPKISDFGLSRFNSPDSGNYTKSDTGPLKWMAPECITDRAYSTKSDVWAYGVLCCELYTRAAPYADTGLDGLQIASKVSMGKLTHTIPSNIPHIMTSIIQNCFSFEPSQREEIGEIAKSIEYTELLK